MLINFKRSSAAWVCASSHYLSQQIFYSSQIVLCICFISVIVWLTNWNWWVCGAATELSWYGSNNCHYYLLLLLFFFFSFLFLFFFLFFSFLSTSLYVTLHMYKGFTYLYEKEILQSLLLLLLLLKLLFLGCLIHAGQDKLYENLWKQF